MVCKSVSVMFSFFTLLYPLLTVNRNFISCDRTSITYLFYIFYAEIVHAFDLRHSKTQGYIFIWYVAMAVFT